MGNTREGMERRDILLGLGGAALLAAASGTARAESRRFEELRELVMAMEADFARFYDQRDPAAGDRIVAGMKRLRALSQEIRAEVQGMQKNED